MQTIEEPPIPEEVKLIYGSHTSIRYVLVDEVSLYFERLRSAYLEPYKPEENALTPFDVHVYALGHFMGRMQTHTQRALCMAKRVLNDAAEVTKTMRDREKSRRFEARRQRLDAGQLTPHLIGRAVYNISGLGNDGLHIKVGKQDENILARLERISYEQDLAP